MVCPKNYQKTNLCLYKLITISAVSQKSHSKLVLFSSMLLNNTYLSVQPVYSSTQICFIKTYDKLNSHCKGTTLSKHISKAIFSPVTHSIQSLARHSGTHRAEAGSSPADYTGRPCGKNESSYFHSHQSCERLVQSY